MQPDPLDFSKVYTLQSVDALARWDEIEPKLNRIDVVGTPLANVREKVASCEAQVWCIGAPIECVLVTKIENTPEKPYGLLWLAAGDLRLIEVANKIVEPWFKSMGCEFVHLVGRRGWKKFLPEYTEMTINLVKQL